VGVFSEHSVVRAIRAKSNQIKLLASING